MKYRIEKDSFGEIKVSADALWGAQTQRSLENFKIGTQKMPIEVIKAIIIIKKAAAKINSKFKKLNQNIADAIIQSCDMLLTGDYDDHFPLVVWQTGSGTQTNMNVNEVIANLSNLNNNSSSLEIIHPNDHVNMGQSSNDTFPSAMHIATYLAIDDKLIPAMEYVYNAFLEKEKEFMSIIKIGRTHMQDATPISLGQEFSAFRMQLENNILRLKHSLNGIKYLAQGGTAVGTGINSFKGFDIEIAKEISDLLGKNFETSPNKFEALASNDAMAEVSGVLNILAISFMKIANDIRLLASGPRCGIGELSLPENEPGSSIMPGKVNPTQCEAATMVAVQIMGYNNAVTIACSNGHFQLNVFKPVIIYNILESINLLSDLCYNFVNKMVKNIKANEATIAHLMNNSLMLVTSLNEHIGYDNAAKIAKNAHKKNISLKESAIELELVTAEEFDIWVDPKKMLNAL